MKKRKPAAKRPKVEPCYLEIGAAIRHYRAARDMSQAELGTRIGVTRASVANLESALQRTMLHQLPTIARALRVKTRDLLPRDWP